MLFQKATALNLATRYKPFWRMRETTHIYDEWHKSSTSHESLFGWISAHFSKNQQTPRCLSQAVSYCINAQRLKFFFNTIIFYPNVQN